MRKYDNNVSPSITWTNEATQEDQDCYNSGFGGCSIDVLFDVCTGQGELRKSSGGGGGGGNVCSIVTDEGPSIITVPCCAAVDLFSCFPTIYNFYDEGTNSGELYSGSFTYQGTSYTVSSGNLEMPPSTLVESVSLMSTTEGASLMSSGTLLGTFTMPYEDESIDFDNIGELQLTDIENQSNNPPCKFSYNFSFTPEEGIDYYVMALPCDSAAGYATVSLAQDGRAYFISSYDETSKKCTINQTQIVV